jgi:hypothetical protein
LALRDFPVRAWFYAQAFSISSSVEAAFSHSAVAVAI